MRLGFRTIITAAGVVVLLLAFVDLARRGVVEVPLGIAFCVLVAVGSLVSVVIPGERRLMAIGQGAYIAYALHTMMAAGGPRPSLSQIMVVGAVGVVVGSLPRVFVEGGARVELLADRIIVLVCLPPVFWLLHMWLGSVPTLVEILGAIVGVGVVQMVQTGVMAVCRYEMSGGKLYRLFRDELVARWPFQLFGTMFGVILGITVHVVGPLGIVVALVPAATTQIAILRWTTVRNTRMETVRSLSRIPELGGYVGAGHSRRVGDLSLEIARELGLSESRGRQLSLAAMMHDIGQLSLADPVPGGTTSLLDPRAQRRIARLGAEVIRESGGLDEVATFVEKLADPYRRSDGRRDEAVPLESRIIKVANAYDDLVGTSPDPEMRLQAIERIELELSRDYDPDVTRALGRVVERRQRVPVG